MLERLGHPTIMAAEALLATGSGYPRPKRFRTL